MSGVEHPTWCDIDGECTAEPEKGVPFSEGEHRSRPVTLSTDQILWAAQPGTVTAFLTQRDCAAWPTQPHLHIWSSAHGPRLEMPVSALLTLADQLGGLVGTAELDRLAAAGPPEPARRVVVAQWPQPPRVADTPRWRSS